MKPYMSLNMCTKIDNQFNTDTILYRKGIDYSRVRAAKDLFDAFVNRTLAYKFHHVIGLVTFQSKVEVQLQLTEVLPSLIVSCFLSNYYDTQ